MVRVEHLKTKLLAKAPSILKLDGNIKENGKLAARQAMRATLLRRVEENGGDVEEAARSFGRSRSWAFDLLKPPSSESLKSTA